MNKIEKCLSESKDHGWILIHESQEQIASVKQSGEWIQLLFPDGSVSPGFWCTDWYYQPCWGTYCHRSDIECFNMEPIAWQPMAKGFER